MQRKFVSGYVWSSWSFVYTFFTRNEKGFIVLTFVHGRFYLVNIIYYSIDKLIKSPQINHKNVDNITKIIGTKNWKDSIIHTIVSVQKLMGVYPLCILRRIGSIYLRSDGIFEVYPSLKFIFIFLSMIFPTYNKVEGKNLLENFTLIDVLLSILFRLIFYRIYSLMKY